MTLSKYIFAEIKKLKANRSVIVSVLLVIFVPIVYAMIMLSPKWGPYDNLDNVPVAVINNDEGAISEGEQINVGDELVKSLKGNPTLKWDFVTTEEAQRGMEKMKYYMTIEVPQNFSENVLTVMDDNPKKPELKYTQNEGLHFMAAQVTDSAINTIKNQLSTQVTETYVRNVFSQLGDVADGFEDAADGSEQINDGVGQLKDGSDEILSNLTEKASDISRLATGAKELEAGTKEMSDSLVSKQGDISKLADGSKQLNAGTGELLSNLENKSGDISKLANGSKQLNEGTNELKSNLIDKSSDISKLANGAKEVNDGTGLLLSTLQDKSSDINKLSKGASELEAGAKELQSGATQVLDGLKAAKIGSDQLNAGLTGQLIPGSRELAEGVHQAQEGVNDTIASMEGLYEALQQLPDSVDGLENNVLYKIIMNQLNESLADAPQKKADFQRLVDGANQLRDGLQEGSEFQAGMTSLNDGLSELVDGQTKITAGTKQLADGAGQVADGNKTVASGWGELETNVAKLHDGTTQIKDGNKSVESGWQALTEGATRLYDGSSQIKEGNSAVKSGWRDLTAGTTQLHDGASQISVGNQTVENGWRELSAGATKIHDGSAQISDGNQTVETGWKALTDGVAQVDDGLAQVKDGSEELTSGLKGGAEQTGSINPTDDNILMFAAPVQLDGEIINSFPFYRDANAPYIITLALFVGVLAMSFVVSFRKPVILPPTGMSWFTGKLATLSLLSIAQALVISLFSLLYLKIQVQSSFLFIIFAIWVSLTFLMIILFLVAFAGNIGRFAALIFAVLQLSTTGSALPIHMLPEGLRTLSTFLPFTYSIKGFKNIITLGSTSSVWANMGVLFIYLAAFGILALLVFLFKYRYFKEHGKFNEDVGEYVG